ncbi:MAG: hypothetical protein ABI840_09620 [bacterium]
MKNKIIYELSVEDIYEVCNQTLDRDPTKEEIKFIEENIGDNIAWFDIIEELLLAKEEKQQSE